MAIDQLQCPRCESNRITQVGDDLFCLACGLRENLYDFPIHDPAWEPRETSDLERHIEDLEARIGQSGSIPRFYHDRFQQLQAETTFLSNKLNTHLDKRRKRKPVMHRLKAIE